MNTIKLTSLFLVAGIACLVGFSEANAQKFGGSLGGAVVGGVVGEAIGRTTDDVGGVVGGAVGAVVGATGNVGGAVGGVVGAIGGAAGNVAGSVGGAVGSIAGQVGGAVGGATGAVSGAVGSIAGQVGSVVGGATGAVSGLAGQATGAINGAIGGIAGQAGGAVNNVIGGVAGQASGILGGDIVSAITAQQSSPPAGGGAPTMDYANIVVGAMNVDSVFSTFGSSMNVRDDDTRICSIVSQGSSGGGNCCDLWQGAGYFASKQICCMLSPGVCDKEAQEKVDCMKKQKDVPSGWAICQVECGKKSYTDLVHNPDGTYDMDKVETFVKECYGAAGGSSGGGSNWSPSATVLTPSEMAPVVPEDIKELLAGGGK